VRRVEGIIVCRHTREKRRRLNHLNSHHKHWFSMYPSPLTPAPNFPFAHTGRDVVFCSSESVGCSAADISIVASGARHVVFGLRGRTHVAAAQDCGADELVYAAMIAYCHAAAGALPSRLFSHLLPPHCLFVIVCMSTPHSCQLHDFRRLPLPNDLSRMELGHAPAAAGQPRAALCNRARQVVIVATRWIVMCSSVKCDNA
jgi:hypothetical protein